MKKRIVNAKIACLDINLQKARMQLGIQILVDDPDQLEDIRKRYVYAIHTMAMSCSNSPFLVKLKSL
jgi:T-complex protein 1 subunit alpha